MIMDTETEVQLMLHAAALRIYHKKVICAISIRNSLDIGHKDIIIGKEGAAGQEPKTNARLCWPTNARM